ncbi:AAA family ATPase [Lentzea sp. NBC_00516]|uniref:BTAD domain-containing putative transcriptional regulator n=1 Tax=Lentzea sp. NBC_00516 TaxID=2903582 RepID=UPI002E7FC3BF|nr:BTAD domain-containing putative transcriptional regulator [Lentzea sp. NBC_00516]WUD26495.1 AAA family ATPase [Lentzea sp. NBC_00516]
MTLSYDPKARRPTNDIGSGPTAVRISLLGPVSAWGADGEVELGSAQRKAVLAVLALQAGHSVSKSELVDALWGDEPPATAQGSIYSHISGLRASLEPHRPRRSEGTLLTSVGAGYCLTLPGDAVDVTRFQQLRDEARACRNNRDTLGELAALETALDLWRGDALDGTPGPFAARQRARLAELKLDAVERRARILLNAGRPHLLIDDLHELTRRHPLREGLHGLLMQALYLTGRRQAAIGVFQRQRSATVESLGTEPGGSLTTVHDKIVRDDPALRWTVDGVPGMTRPIPLVTKTLRPTTRRLIGRVSEIAAVRTAVTSVTRGTGGVLWLEGEQGIGKTAVLNEALADARGCQLAWVTADEFGQVVPLRALVDGLDVTRLSPDPRRASLAATVRRVELSTTAQDSSGTVAAVDGVLALVGQLCEDGPLVLVVDQLHWVDPVSLHVLRQLATETAAMPLLLVVALRPVPSRQEIDRTRAVLRQHGQVITLGPLADAQVDDLVTALAGATPGPALLELSRQAAGNPWLVEVLVEYMTSSGVLVPEDHQVDLKACSPPPNHCTIVDVIEDHMQTVPKHIRDLLGWASLCGDGFTLDEIAAALMLPAHEVSTMVADAVTGGYLVVSGDEFSLRHKMIQRAFYGRYASAIRGSLHRQLAEAWIAIGRPPERVAQQLMLVPIDNGSWLNHWLTENAAALSVRAPRLASTLLGRLVSSDAISSTRKDNFSALLVKPAVWCEDTSDFTRDLLAWYWGGQWEEALTALTAVRLTHGTAALICAHRGEPGEALATLEAVGREADQRESAVARAASALVAEQRGEPVAACDVLVGLLDDESVPADDCARWLPWLVRLAVDQERESAALRAIAVADSLPEQRATALHCRALLAQDPEAVLVASGEYRRAGREFAYAQAAEDASVLLVAQEQPEKAAEALDAAVQCFTQVRARWDMRRAFLRFDRAADHV